MYELGRSKRASHAYSFDDVAIAPARRTRGEDEVDLTWKIDAVSFDVPIVAAPMDSVMSPSTAIEMGRLGGLGVLNLEGLWTRYEDPQPAYELLTQDCDQVTATKRLHYKSLHAVNKRGCMTIVRVNIIALKRILMQNHLRYKLRIAKYIQASAKHKNQYGQTKPHWPC